MTTHTMGIVRFDDEACYGKLNLGRNFYNASWISQLDFLQGLLSDASAIYEAMLNDKSATNSIVGIPFTKEQVKEALKGESS